MTRGHKRLIVIGLILVIGVIGWLGWRWWDGEDHREQQFLSQLQDMSGVESAGDSQRGAEIELSSDATAEQAAAVIQRIGDRSDFSATVIAGQARTHVRSSSSAADTGSMLVTVSRAELPQGATVDVLNHGSQVDVDLNRQGSTVDAGVAILGAVAESPDAEVLLTGLIVRERPSSANDYGFLGLTIGATPLTTVAADLEKLAPLKRWHPSITAGPNGMFSASLLLNTEADAPAAVGQARTLLGRKANISYQVGYHGTRVSGSDDPAGAMSLVKRLASDTTAVTRLDAAMASIEVRTAGGALDRVLSTVRDAGVKHIHVAWDSGELDLPVAQAIRALPAVTRLRDLGYTTVWVGPAAYDREEPQRIGVSPISREPDHSGAPPAPEPSYELLRAVRALGWSGLAEVHIATRTGEQSSGKDVVADTVFYSTATGRARGGKNEKITNPDVTSAWDTTAGR